MDPSRSGAPMDTNRISSNSDDTLPLQIHGERSLPKPVQKLRMLEDEIAATEKHLQHLRQDREILLKDMNKSLSLIQRVPHDILCEIFVSCLPDDHLPTMSRDDAPVLLTRICSAWRTIAMSTPQLWNALHIPVPRYGLISNPSYDPTTGMRRDVERLTYERLQAMDAWIKRSGKLPLSFSLHEYHVPLAASESRGRLFSDFIIDYRERWKSLSLACTFTLAENFLRIPTHEVPRLESLSIRLRSFPVPMAGQASYEWKKYHIFSAPKIHSVAMSGIITRIFGLPFRWSQLTHFGLGDQWPVVVTDTSLDDIISILQNCPNLLSCDLRLGGDCNRQPVLYFPPLHFPKLKSLKIRDGARVPTFCSSISAPELRRLEYICESIVRLVSSAPQASVSSLHSLLSQVGLSLEELTISPGVLELNDPANLFLLCPSLKSLSIIPVPNMMNIVPPFDSTTPLSSSFIRALDSVPNLEHFNCNTEAHFSDEVLLDFILRKQSGEDPQVKPLKSVSVQFSRPQTVDISAALQTQISNRLILNLNYPPRSFRGSYSQYEGLSSIKGDSWLQPQAPY